METLSIPAAAWFSGGAIPPPHARLYQPYLLRKPPSRDSRRLSAFNAASRSGNNTFLLSLSLYLPFISTRNVVPAQMILIACENYNASVYIIVSELVGEDVLQMFLKDREENGDFISKVSDRLWLREVLESVDLNSYGASSAIGLEDNQVNYVNR